MFIHIDMKEVYIADSESSSIRALDLKTGGSRLLVGGDPIFSDNLFKVLSFLVISNKLFSLLMSGMLLK